MAEEKDAFLSDEEIVLRVCADFGLTKEETESIARMGGEFEQTKGIENPLARAKKRVEIMLGIIARFP
ncbi:MAG: hypothetical protein Q7R92_01630 [bacterium]|nr:hypothetical protein [bacterium]